MGGDGGVAVTVPASVQALKSNPELSVYLVGDERQIKPFLASADSQLQSRISILHTTECISAADKPGAVLRSARQSSMFKAVELLQNGDVTAMVSAGNTGALLMIGRHLIKTIEGIQKPAMVATLPGASRQCYLLDVGANLECSAQQLFEFAVMGSVLAESLSGGPVRVALLNIGSEQYKGTEAVRAAGDLMENCKALNYSGFIEANALFEGEVDVVVCDGFVGNVTIKSSAGVANVVKNLISRRVGEDTNASNATALQILNDLSEQINPHRFNGASLLGLQGSIVKSHGNATIEGFAYALQQAVNEVNNAVPGLIATRVASIIGQN